MESTFKSELMVKAAQLYYEDNCTQQEIARELSISRTMVSRLLTEARQTKLVEIIIHYPWLTNHKLETALKKKYALQDASVLAGERLDPEKILSGIGVMGAKLLEKYLKTGMTLGIARGTGVYSAVQALRPQRHLKLRIVQLQGAMGETLSDGSDIAHFLSTRYEATFHFLHAPLILESKEATRALMKEHSIRETLEIARNAGIALVGIGSVEPQVSSLLRTGHVTEQELREFSAEGIIGDVAGRHINAEGESPNAELSDRLVCIDVPDLRRIPIVIGVAGGKLKVRVIRAALRGKLINMLATDAGTAEALLKD